jgi:hypothetical protein
MLLVINGAGPERLHEKTTAIGGGTTAHAGADSP